MTARALPPEARRAIVVEALADAIVAEVRRLQEGLRAAALALLEAVDQGAPAGDLARTLAVEALRRLPPDSPGWCHAVEVLEGGPLRMRRAVDLAGLALDATDAADAELRRRLSARNG